MGEHADTLYCTHEGIGARNANVDEIGNVVGGREDEANVDKGR